MVTSGLLLVVFTGPNHYHTSEPQALHEENSGKVVGESWAASQVVSSQNFCTDSKLVYFLSSGLNFQIEHHLFPGVNQCYLPLIAPTVRDTCKEFGIPYQNDDSLTTVFGKFLNWMQFLGSP